MSEAPRAAPGGWFDTLTALAASLLGMARTRLELLSADVDEARAQWTACLAWLLVALFCLGMSVALWVALIVLAFESHRLLALGLLAGLFLLLGLASGVTLRYRVRRRPKLFAASLAELSRDRQQLGGGP